MSGALKRLAQRANRHAGKLLLLGLAGVAVHNWRQWQRDRTLLARQPEPEPLPPPDSGTDLPPVSVLVAAWNEGDMIEGHIESFLRLRYPHKELVLCAGGDDGTYDLAEAYAADGMIVIRQEAGEGKQRALRRCLDRATGEIIFLTDADCLLADNPFERTLEPILQGCEYVTTGDHRPLDRQLTNSLAVYQWFVNRYLAAQAVDHIGGLKGANCAIHRDALERVGAFRDDVPIGTDYHLAKKLLDAGYRIRYVHDSEVQTEYPDDIIGYRSEHSRWTRNIIGHSLRFKEHRTMLAGLLTVSTGTLMFALPLSFALIGRLGPLLWFLLYIHAYLSRIRYTVFGRSRTGRKLMGPNPVELIAFIWLDIFTWASVVVDLLVPKRRGRW